MQTGFQKPIVVTGSQLPLAMPRSDARQNLIDSVTCLTAFFSPPHVHLQVRRMLVLTVFDTFAIDFLLRGSGGSSGGADRM